MARPPGKAAARTPAPAVISGCTTAATRRGRQMLAPATTATNCSSEPHIACSMKSTTIRWVIAKAPGDQRDSSAAGPSQARTRPATAPNSGAVRKNR